MNKRKGLKYKIDDTSYPSHQTSLLRLEVSEIDIHIVRSRESWNFIRGSP